jgi:hypothetical protein
MLRTFLIPFFIPILCFSQQKEADSSSINEIVRKLDKLSKTNNRLFVNDKLINNKKIKENWQYFDNKQLSEIVIDYIVDSAAYSERYYSTAYSEKYYFKDGALINAYESEVFFLPDLGIDQGTMWAGDFYFSKGKLIDYVTVGHGKSELDDWDPEKEILQRLKKRKAELQLLK